MRAPLAGRAVAQWHPRPDPRAASAKLQYLGLYVLHVDESEGVQIEGYDHGFRVVVVRPDDEQWADKVLEAVARVQAQLAWQQQPRRHKVPAPVYSGITLNG